MNSRSESFSELAESFGERWNRFWFAPSDPLPACILRIVVGLLAAAHFLDVGVGLSDWYSTEGVVSPASMQRLLELTGGEAQYHVSYLNRLPASTGLWLIHGLAIGAALAFSAGLLTRLSGALTLIAVLAYIHRLPLLASHIDPVLSFLLLYLCISPCGAYLSVDRRLFGPDKKRSLLRLVAGLPEPSMTARIGLRLIQVHVAMFYAMMGLTKLYGDAWWDGNAVWILLAQTESRPLDLTGLRSAGQLGEYALNFWTHAIVYFELTFAVLIWTRIGRPVLLGLSVVVWLSIIIVTGQLLFGLAMLACSVAFVPAEALPVVRESRATGATAISVAAS
jgi:hypothetical protein